MSDGYGYIMPSDIFFCELCNSFHAGLMSFASHTAEKHQISSIEYWDKHPYLTLADYEKTCRNPHERVYRGCSADCFLYDTCQAKLKAPNNRIKGVVEKIE